MIYLDTHVILWLYEGTLDFFTHKGKQLLAENDLLISPIIILELQYLFEIKKSRLPPDKILAELHETIGLSICELPFLEIVSEANKLLWTRDPFDRLIVGNAMIGKKSLLTKDNIIRKHFHGAVW